jgi:uncharacterized protein (TIGR03067 family)
MRYVPLLFALVVVLPVYADDKDAVAKELQKLQGTWVISTVERGGEAMPAEKGFEAVIKGGKLQFLNNGQQDHEEALEIDPGKDPKHITLTREEQGKKRTVQGIYALDGDTLKLCLDGSEKGRPAKFTTKDTQEVWIFVMKRK